MKIIMVSGCPYEDFEGQILNLDVELGEGEVVSLNSMISIEMMDDSFLQTEVLIINPKRAGDYSVISDKAKEYGMSKKMISSVKGPCNATLVVKDVPYHEVKTDQEINSRRILEEMNNKVCLSPFKELNEGDKSIYDFVRDGYSVPDKVIAYLRIKEPYMMSPGVYDHPFKTGTQLLGPYLYTDGYYYWDRDLWKYVIKYHVTLPQEFIDYVMSNDVDPFFESYIDKSDLWTETIKKMKKKQGILCLLPQDSGDKELSDF
ncbi:MAG: hypothetical protein IKO61_04215 [Lachnospiraceae bacterium]|nr:hypothetical protein [Lachnospiraceae bacterium]